MLRKGVVLLALILLVTTLGTHLTATQAQSANLAVYLESDGMLYSIPVAGGKSTLLNPASVQVRGYSVTATGSVVIRGTDGNLYSVSVQGGTPIKLTEKPLFNSDTSAVVSRDGKYVVFLSENQPRSVGLYSVPVSGGTATALLPENLQFGTDRFSVHSFYFIGADSTQVFFTAHNARKVFQAYVVPITGGEAKQINAKLTSGGNVLNLWVEENTKQIVYLADQSKDEVFGLYSVPPQGGDPVTLTEGQDNLRVIDRNQQVAITPDGKTIVFMLYGSSRARIYSVASTGGKPTPISELAQNLRGFGLSPDGKWVVYSWGGLFQIEPNGGGQPYKINSGVTNFAFSPDGKWVYSMIISKGNTMSSLPFPAKPGDKPVSLAPEELNIRTSAAGGFAYLASPDSQYVVTLVTDKDRIPALHSAAVDGKTPPVQLNTAFGSSTFVPKASITADSSTVVYINDEETAKTGDLYAVPIAGGKATRLTTDDSKGVISLQVFPPGANWTFTQ